MLISSIFLIDGINALKCKSEKYDGIEYDASMLIDNSGEIIGIQKMVHVAQAKQFYEQDYYTPSDDGFKVNSENSFGYNRSQAQKNSGYH